MLKAYKERTNFEAVASANTAFLIASIYDQFTEKKNRRNIQFDHFLPFPDAYAKMSDLKETNNRTSLTVETKQIIKRLLKAGKLQTYLYAVLAPYWNMTEKSEDV